MSQRFIILAGLSLLCSSDLAGAAGTAISVSGYSVPAAQQDAVQEGYRHESLSFGFVAKSNGYTNAGARISELCRAFTQPDGSNLYMIATYQTAKGCDDMYIKQLK